MQVRRRVASGCNNEDYDVSGLYRNSLDGAGGSSDVVVEAGACLLVGIESNFPLAYDGSEALAELAFQYKVSLAVDPRLLFINFLLAQRQQWMEGAILNSLQDLACPHVCELPTYLAKPDAYLRIKPAENDSSEANEQGCNF